MAAYHTLQYAARRTQTSPVLSKAGFFLALAFRPTPGSTLKILPPQGTNGVSYRKSVRPCGDLLQLQSNTSLCGRS